MKRPKNWRDEVTPIYLEEGEAIGRMIMHDRDQEEYLWSLLGGTGIWPRWYLFSFAQLYREAHILEYDAQKSRKYRSRKRKRDKKLELELLRPKSLDESSSDTMNKSNTPRHP